jgi:formylglycine-generating enzyme required for sulfatase activity
MKTTFSSKSRRDVAHRVSTLATVAIIWALSTVSTKAQVTIGSLDTPQNFSILELISNNTRGLRLPQLTQAERDLLDGTEANTSGASTAMLAARSAFATEKTGKAEGLQIFNTTTKCVNTWNGTVWIEECYGSGTLCATPAQPSAISGSTTVSSGATSLTYSVTAVAGVTYTWAVTGTGWSITAGQSTNSITVNAGTADGTITVTPSNACGNGTARTLDVTVETVAVTPVTAARFSTFVNVMYDFQYQELGAFTTTGGSATDYQWQYSPTSNASDFVNIPGAANSASYTIPADFVFDYGSNYPDNAYIDTIYFRCLMSNSATGTPVSTGNTFNIIFIKTKVSKNGAYLPGYGEDANGVKYGTLRKGSGGAAGAGNIKIALLNLGIDDNNAADLGDFYQWGRIPDGHQKTVWSKNADHENQILPMDGVNTSAVINSVATSNGNNPAWNNEVGVNFDQATAVGEVGKFVAASSSNSSWSAVKSNFRWGQSTQKYTPEANRDPDKSANDPCPTGWKVPSGWQIWDIYRGIGTDNPGDIGGSYWTDGDDIDNTWTWRASNGYGSTVIGGAIVKNPDTNARIFWPAAGLRSYINNGELQNHGANGVYWSSTARGSDILGTGLVNTLHFQSISISPNSEQNQAYGYSVRCVTEEEPSVALESPFAASSCYITANAENTVFTAKEDPNAISYEFFVGNSSKGKQTGRVLTLAAAVDPSTVTVQYYYEPEFLKPVMKPVAGNINEEGNGLTWYYNSSNYPSTRKIPDFYMSETEVTQAQYAYIMGANPSFFCCNCPGGNYVSFRPTSALPVEQVNWYATITYCNKLSIMEGKEPCYSIPGVDSLNLSAGGADGHGWINIPGNYDNVVAGGIPKATDAVWDAVTCNFAANGFRLPTESEWEYAARGGKGTSPHPIFSGSYSDTYSVTDLCSFGWFEGNQDAATTCGTASDIFGTKPVGEKTPNIFGLYDMSGNVFEWCYDWYGYYFPNDTPTGIDAPAVLTRHMTRGGSFFDPANYCRVFSRYASSPDYDYSDTGFRLASSY